MKLLLSICLVFFLLQGNAQQFITKTGYISFLSQTPLEDIKAYNNQVFAIIDGGKKNLAFTLLMRGFLFTRQLQQDHFNENYVESDKFPKASFSGSFTGDPVLTSDGEYPVQVSGALTIHGVTRQVTAPANFEMKSGKLTGTCTFIVKPEDFNIVIPSLVRDKIAKTVAISVQAICSPR